MDFVKLMKKLTVIRYSRVAVTCNYKVKLYSFMLGGKGILVFRTDNAARTETVIRENSLAALDDKALLSLDSVEEEGGR